MNKLASIGNFIGQHKYGITLLAFSILVGFIDDNSFVRRAGYAHEISVLQGEIDKFRSDYEESTKSLKELTNDPDAIEQIAREKYLMKKPNEDIYVFKN